MIKFRIDVDYPYPSRIKSFLYTLANLQTSNGYLENAKILARMFNDSSEELTAYWFFTTKTLPDKELLKLLTNPKHELALHVVNSPNEEMKLLERITQRPIRYYTIHGTAHLLTRIIWRRWRAKFPSIPKSFSLQSFHRYPTLPLDGLCYKYSATKAYKIAKENLCQEKILEIHPAWLFNRGKINLRGSYYKTLRQLLKVDEDVQYIAKRKKLFATIARDSREYEIDISPGETFINKLKFLGIDVFTFIERNWSNLNITPRKTWIKTADNVALLQLTSYDAWWNLIGKKTRNMVRKAEKNRLLTNTVTPNHALAEGMWLIFNETPIRQNRYFPHFGLKLNNVEHKIFSSKKNIFIGSFFENKLVGFVDLIIGKDIAIISQLLSLKEYWNKAINNALIAKTVEICVNQQVNWLMYGRMGNHPSLDKFKHNVGFRKFSLVRYYIILSLKGKIAAKMGIHRDLKDILPNKITNSLLPVYNWISRIKMKKS